MLELLAAQHGLDAGGFGVEVAAAGVFERGPDLAAVQLSAGAPPVGI
jgi:hypothetical protein